MATIKLRRDPADAVAGIALPDAPESLALARVEGTTVAAGADARGLVDAVLELVDRVHHAFGPAAGGAVAALAHASRIALLFTTHEPSANCKILWPELYTTMPISSESGHPYSDRQSPQRFRTVSPLDPELFAGVDEHAASLDSGARSGKYSPLDVAG